MCNVVFHLDNRDYWSQLLSSLEYFVDNAGTGCHTEVVINSSAVRSFSGLEVHPELIARAKALSDKGVDFKICRNSLNNRQISESNIPDFIEIVAQGIAELVQRQQEGYAYIRP